MSRKRDILITCPACGEQQFMRIWSLITAGDNEAWSDMNVTGLNIFRCCKCRFQSFIDEPVLYDDPEKRIAIQYLSCSAVRSDDFFDNYTREGKFVLDQQSALQLQQEGREYLLHPHIVFSPRDIEEYAYFLAECTEHGLDPAGPFTDVKPPQLFQSLSPLLVAGAEQRVSKQLQAARMHLTDKQLDAFFRAARSGCSISALDGVQEDLMNGQTLDDFFASYERKNMKPMNASAPIEERLRLFYVELKVEPLADRVYSITFGFHGSDLGDGGTWLVVYDEAGKLLKCALTDQYIH